MKAPHDALIRISYLGLQQARKTPRKTVRVPRPESRNVLPTRVRPAPLRQSGSSRLMTPQAKEALHRRLLSAMRQRGRPGKKVE